LRIGFDIIGLMKERGPKEIRSMDKYGDCSFCDGEVKGDRECTYSLPGKRRISHKSQRLTDEE